MAYNKVKLVESAQKYLNQGKVPQAIAEYQTILKHEPKDQVTLMTIGDLYVRQGETFQALEYFERLAQIFLNDGFVTKAIAIYKKIAKLAPEESKPLEKLAELYVQQGVMSEARPLYLQLAEVHLKANRHPQAVALLQKLLEAEPDNLRVRLRLGDLYHLMGRESEATETFLGAAQHQFERREFAEAERLVERALKIDSAHVAALLLKARALAGLGKRVDAVNLLENLPELDTGSEPAVLLVELYLQGGESARAAQLAGKVAARDPKNYELTYKVATALVENSEVAAALELLAGIRGAMIDAGDHERLAQVLLTAADRQKGRLEPLEWLVDLYGRASDSFRLPDALGQLGEAAAAVGNLERARETFEQLLDREPENENARRRANQIRAQLGLGPYRESAEVPPTGGLKAAFAPTPQPPAPAKAAEPELDEETSRFVAQALTDVDLFSSYGLAQKAIDLLEQVLQRAPRHTPSLEKLLDLHLGAGNERGTTELAAQLEQIYLERGQPSKAEHFGELRKRFQRASGMAPEEVAAAVQQTPPPAISEFAVPMVEAEPVPVEAQSIAGVEAVPTGEAAVHEVDLSEDWAALAQQLDVAAKAEEQAASSSTVAPEAASMAEATAAEPVPVSAAPAPPAALELVGANASATSGPVPASAETESVMTAPTNGSGSPTEEVPAEYELVLDADPAEPLDTLVAAPELPPAARETQSLNSGQFLNDLLGELDALAAKRSAGPLVSAPIQGARMNSATPAAPQTTLAASPPPAPPPVAAVPPVARPAAASAGDNAGPLREVFDEFRAELGEMGFEDEDLETHYNLGIAYREMGLLDEAIGEFQKVAQAIDRGRAFRYSMQCCTLLGLSFMDKGQPQIAAMWYERALATPGLDPESILALRYDLGVAQELAGEESAALKSYMQVYAMNIDYRDVAERIATLGKRR